MAHRIWQICLGTACLSLSLASLDAAESVKVTPVGRYRVVQQSEIPAPQVSNYCDREDCYGCFHWNGQWGPGKYWAVRPPRIFRPR